MNNFKMLLIAVSLIIAACNQVEERKPAQDNKPNVIILYIDDLGYGDVGVYGAKGVATPNVDKLAAEGVRFTDAHSTAATCTPSRYSLLTGEHGFRRKAAILPGDAPALIRPGTPTLPSMLKKAGYTTAVVGKWHLGLGDGNVDWNQDVKPGPLEIGFDYSFLLPATGDRVPTVYLENYKVVNLDPADPIEVSYEEKVGNRIDGLTSPDKRRIVADTQHSQTIVNGISRIGYMGGGESALWVDEEFPDVFTGKAVEFIRANKDKPFFLFHSFHDIHVPRVPNPRFQGKSTMGPRGDAIAQMDWMVGEIMKELEAQGIADNTIVLFTSDNGPVLDDGYSDRAIEMLGDHKPSGPFRGGKYSAFEAGTRMPTIMHWPAKIKKPMVSDALVSQVDIYASLASLLNIELATDEAIDSLNTLQAFLGESSTGREYMLEEALGTYSLRKGQWKYIVPLKADMTLPDWLANKHIEGGLQYTPQLYNLAEDINEQHNLVEQNPEMAAELLAKYNSLLNKGFRQ